MIIPFYRCDNWDTEKLGNFPKVISTVSDAIGSLSNSRVCAFCHEIKYISFTLCSEPFVHQSALYIFVTGLFIFLAVSFGKTESGERAL